MWRIIDISGENYSLICDHENLVALNNGQERLRAHFSDINCLIIGSYSTVLSLVLIQKLIDYNIPLLICDRFHNPAGIMLQTFKHTQYGNRLQLQISTKKPLLKKAWKQIISAKIKNQAEVLLKLNKDREYKILIGYFGSVKSGDKTNREAVSSRLYFQSLFDNFKREPESNDIINSSLNYSYAVLRSNVARAVVGAGLNPALGIFHSYKNNYFCLIDDLMEPLRPFIDLHIKRNINSIINSKDLTSDIKKILVSIMDEKFDYNNEVLDMTNVIQRYIYSYIDYLEKKINRMDIPELK
jgi:CRISPR-associated protein Cas1